MPYRLRLTYSKTGPIRYTGHLDLLRLWERAIRRSCLPIAYTQGFHPQAKINMACALPLGFISQGELIELWLETAVPIDDIKAMLDLALPPGLQIQKIEEIDLTLPPVQTQVKASLYKATYLEPVDQEWLNRQVTRLLEMEHISRTRRDKNYNLRSLVESLEYLPQDDNPQPRLIMQLSAREGATGRPEEVLSELGLDPVLARIERLRLVLA